MATMREVAAQAGVSYTTVSYVLNQRGAQMGISDATRQRVFEVARSLNFVPNPHAQNLSHGRCNNTIGVFTFWFGTGVGTQKVQSIQSVLNPRGFDVPIYGLGLHDFAKKEVQVAALNSIRRQKPRGLVCFTQGLYPEALLELQHYQEEGGVLVCYDYPVDLPCDTILFDREDNTYQATRHLLDLGHRRIGYADHGLAPLDGPRLRGFRRALEEYGVPWCDHWRLEGGESYDYERGGQMLAAQYLELQDRPSALCMVNDATALVFMAELERAGLRCPQALSLVGHDDHVFSRYASVPLTTVTHPVKAIAQHVTDFLLSRLNGDYQGPARQLTVRGELIVRSSAAAPAQ